MTAERPAPGADFPGNEPPPPVSIPVTVVVPVWTFTTQTVTTPWFTLTVTR